MERFLYRLAKSQHADRFILKGPLLRTVWRARASRPSMDIHLAGRTNNRPNHIQAILGDINKGESMTMAPIVAKGMVIVGNSGGEFGVRGWLAGLDARDGKIVWRAYSTGPDKDVLIGAGFQPFYAADRSPDLGMKTWPGDAWKIGGGSGWSWNSFDPDLDLIYYGTSNPGPWNADQRPGDKKWTCTIFARRPETGEAVWAYQINPHDDHDYDGVNENMLLDLTINGKPRKVLVHPDRNAEKPY